MAKRKAIKKEEIEENLEETKFQSYEDVDTDEVVEEINVKDDKEEKESIEEPEEGLDEDILKLQEEMEKAEKEGNYEEWVKKVTE